MLLPIVVEKIQWYQGKQARVCRGTERKVARQKAGADHLTFMQVKTITIRGQSRGKEKFVAERPTWIATLLA